jgi:hypothetical protein
MQLKAIIRQPLIIEKEILLTNIEVYRKDGRIRVRFKVHGAGNGAAYYVETAPGESVALNVKIIVG